MEGKPCCSTDSTTSLDYPVPQTIRSQLGLFKPLLVNQQRCEMTSASPEQREVLAPHSPPARTHEAALLPPGLSFGSEILRCLIFPFWMILFKATKCSHRTHNSNQRSLRHHELSSLESGLPWIPAFGRGCTQLRD